MINVYLSVIILLLILLVIEIKNVHNLTVKNAVFYIGTLSIFSLIAFRGTEVGGDTSAYANFFIGKHSMYGTIDNSDMEIGFIWIAKILHLINKTKIWFLFSSTFITLFPFFYMVKKYSCNKTIPLLLFMTIWSIMPTALCAVRQNLAVSLVMVAYILFIEKIKNKHVERFRRKVWMLCCILLCILSVLTHTSMIVALPLLFLAELVNIRKKTAYIIVFASFLIVLIIDNLFNSLFSLFNEYTAAFSYADRMNGYFENADYALTNEVSFNRLAPTTFWVLLLIFKSKEEVISSTFLKCLIWGNSLYCIGASFPMISRSVYLLMLMGIVYVPFSLYSKRKQLSNVLLFLLLVFFVRTQFKYFSEYNVNENYYGVRLLPYKTIFEER